MTLTPSERDQLRYLKSKANAPAREARKRIKKAVGKQDRGRVRDTAHLAFIRRLPCVATYVRTGLMTYGCQAAHVRMVRDGKSGGMGVKPSDRWTVPLTPNEHDRQTNRGGERGYWSELGVDPIALADRLYAVSGDEAAATLVIRAARELAYGPETGDDQ